MDDLSNGVELGIIAARFHQALVEVVSEICSQLREEMGLDKVVISGGVWQNKVLLERTVGRLESDGFEVLWHRRVPANDGGLALGQAIAAAAQAGLL
jgi:hydrogenase maturation protein HypF